jgi:hypothetical protein
MPYSSYSEARDPAMKAKEIRLMCPHCKNFVYIVLPYKPGAWTRQGLIREAIDDHRRVCTSADIMQGFVYGIEYPRA